MNQYHKIQTVYKRDPATNHKTLLEGDYSLPELKYLADNEWVFTEKVDGTNIRVMYGDQGLEFRGKSDNAQVPPKLLKALSETFEPRGGVFASKFEDGVCLYGEGYGARIQNGGNYRSDNGFVLFDVRVGDWWLQRADVEDVAAALDIDVVPVIGTGTLGDMVDMAKRRFNSRWGMFEAEGIVARPATELCTRSGHRVITKIKAKDFALTATA